TTRERLPTGYRWLAQLVGVRGVVQHRIYDVDAVALLGRSLNADITIDDPGVSRSHARVQLDTAGGVVIEDLGSRNGLSVNGMPVDRSILTRGDRISLGPGVEFECRVLIVLDDDLCLKHQAALLGKVSAAAALDVR